MRELLPAYDGDDLRDTASTVFSGVANALGSGPAHRYRISDIDVRIVVTGTRGKSTATEWLHDIFHRRGYDTYAKVTGNEPLSIYNGEAHDIERTDQVRLYENERELRRFGNIDAAVVENQGIRQYTTRLVNQSYFKPHVVFLTNIREDHLDTLGHDRVQIARALARSVPPGTVVVNGESDRSLRSYLTAELRRRNAIVRHVSVPSESEWVPGSEIIYGINEVLRVTDTKPLLPDSVHRRLREMIPQWQVLPGGKVYNAADVNDIQSTEMVRQALVGDSDHPIEPLLFLRADRRGRTASFFRYLDDLTERGLAERVHVVGGGTAAFAAKASFPVETYDVTTDPPERVLDSALKADRPLIVMGNTVDEFMRELDDCITRRTMTTRPPASRCVRRLRKETL